MTNGRMPNEQMTNEQMTKKWLNILNAIHDPGAIMTWVTIIKTTQSEGVDS
jgi:hypothetical protein